MQVAVKSTATCFFFAAILIGVLFLFFGGGAYRVLYTVMSKCPI